MGNEMPIAKKENLSKYILAGVFLSGCILAGITAQISFFGIAKFVIGQLVIVLLPGMTIQKLLNITYQKYKTYFFTSYSMGYVINIFLYIIFLITDKQYLIPEFNFLMIIFCLAFMYRNKKQNCFLETDKRENLILSGIYITAFVIGFFCFQMNNRSALLTGYQEMYQDLSYWFKNAVAVTKGYPVPELSCSWK